MAFYEIFLSADCADGRRCGNDETEFRKSVAEISETLGDVFSALKKLSIALLLLFGCKLRGA